MPSKRRRTTVKHRRRQIETPSQFIQLERSYERSDSDIRTIPDYAFGKIYSTQIVSYSQTPSPNASSVIEPKVIIPSKRKKSMKKKYSKNI
jgi:hypothetical protein